MTTQEEASIPEVESPSELLAETDKAVETKEGHCCCKPASDKGDELNSASESVPPPVTDIKGKFDDVEERAEDSSDFTTAKPEDAGEMEEEEGDTTEGTPVAAVKKQEDDPTEEYVTDESDE